MMRAIVTASIVFAAAFGARAMSSPTELEGAAPSLESFHPADIPTGAYDEKACRDQLKQTQNDQAEREMLFAEMRDRPSKRAKAQLAAVEGRIRDRESEIGLSCRGY